jgi:hypothetical protein
MRRTLALALALTALAGCGGGGDDDPTLPEPRDTLTGARAQAPAPVASGTLAQVPDGPAARRRLAFVNLDALAATELPLRRVAAGVLGQAPGAQGTAVRVGDRLATPPAAPPETSAITPAPQSAVQSCLGETLAQTILGPATMGYDAALGAGLAESRDAPAGLQLRICGAPHLIREIHAMERALKHAFPARGNVIGEREIGEREIVFGTVAASTLEQAELLDLVAGGRSLRALAWR